MAPQMAPVAFVRHCYAMANFGGTNKKNAINWSHDGTAVIIPNIKHFVDKVLRRPEFFGPKARLHTFLELLWQHGFKPCVDDFYPAELQAPSDGGYPLCFRHEAFRMADPAGLSRVQKSISRPEAHKMRVEMDRARRALSKRKATTPRRKATPKRPRVKSPVIVAAANTNIATAAGFVEEENVPASNPTLASNAASSTNASTVEWLNDLLSEEIITTPGFVPPATAPVLAPAPVVPNGGLANTIPTAMSIDSDGGDEDEDAWLAAANRLPSPQIHVPSSDSSGSSSLSCIPGDLGEVAEDIEMILQEFDSEDAWESLVEDAHNELFGVEEGKASDEPAQQRRFVQVNREVGLPFPLPYITVEASPAAASEQQQISKRMAGLSVSYRGAAAAA